MAEKFYGKLPDGTVETDLFTYDWKWREVTRPLESLGFTIVAVEPHIRISKGLAVFTVPTEIAIRLKELEEANENIVQ